MMGLKLVQIPFDESPNCKNPYQMDVKKCLAAVNENTIMIYSSAPSFPQGVIDPVTELAEIAVKYDVALHVDCCLGGFILPFARDEYHLALASLAKKREAGASVEACAKEEERIRLLEVPPFDFTVPGVSSMSVDTHKFGYALKGTSVVLYKTKAMRQSQYFCYPQWSGGMYTTPTIAGSRSGGLVAQCWASMMSIGYDGYRDNAVDIMTATKSIAKRIEAIPGLKLLGNYAAMVVCFASDDETVNTYSLADQMSKRGWSLNTLQNPSCVHLCVTRCHCHIGREDLFVGDLVASLEDARAAVRRGDKLNGNAAIYGMASSMPSGPVEELLKCYNDVVLKL
jgi:glutamate/tyrosine decarboxylase-like PLP-dependent enzyme